MRIKTRILISTVAAVLITSATLILVVYFFLFNSLKKQAIQDLHEHVNQAAENIEEHIRVPAYQLKTLADKELIKKDDDSLSEELSESNNMVIEFYSISYSDLKGQILASSDIKLVGKNIKGVVPDARDEFQKILNSKNQKVLISDIQKCRNDRTNSKDSVDMQMLIGVYNQQGKLKGILTALYNIGYLERHVKELGSFISSKGRSFLIKHSGEVLLSSDPSAEILKPVKGMGFNKLKNDFETSDNGYAIFRSKNGKEKLSGFVKLKDSGTNNLHWSLFVEVPYNNFLSPVYRLLYRLLYIIVLFFLLILILVLLFSHNLTKPLAWLTKSTENLGKGQYEKIQFDSKSELGDLVKAYNNAVDKIKNTTQELKENEELFRNLAESTSAGIVIVQDSKIVYINKAATQISGYIIEELGDKDFWDVVHLDFRTMVKEYGFLRQQGGEAPQQYELKLITKNGEERWISLAAGSLLWKGKVASIATLLDLTGKKRAEEKLRFDEQRLRLAQHIGRLGFLDWDLKTSKVEAAPEALEILGLSPKTNILNFNELAKLIHPDDAEIVLKKINNARKGQSKMDFHYRLLTVDGKEKYVWSTAELITDEKGEPVRVLGIIQDITENKKIETSLKLSRVFVDNTYDSIEVADLVTGKFVDVNERGCQILGYTREEFLNLYVFDIDTNLDEKQFKNIKAGIKNTGSEVWETIHKRKDGSTFPVEVNIKLVNLDKEYLVSVSRDITERKLNEQKLIEAKEKAEESEKLKSAFLANMSHEIRTPMNGILGFAELLKEPNLTREEQGKYINIIEKSGDRMLNTVNDIIDISKIESGQMTVSVSETNVNEQMEFIYNFFKPQVEQKGLKLKLNQGLTADKSFIKTDKEKFYSILTNLVKNAIKFTHKGYIELGYSKKDGFLEFYVKDTGTGIPEAQFDSVFQRFVQGSTDLTRDYEGSGLGLTITRAYVEMLGGKIWLESKNGKSRNDKQLETGTVFYYTLPYNDLDRENTTVEKNTSNTDFKNDKKKLKILIVEDDEVSVQYLLNVLKPFTTELMVCRNGLSAIETSRNNLDIDLIIMDIKMPGMDGYETTRAIRKFNKHVVIIAQTAFALQGDREKAIEAGCNDYLSKPVKIEALNKMMKKYFG